MRTAGVVVSGLCGLAAGLPLALATPAGAVPAVAVAPNNTLVLFDTDTPGTFASKPITGLGASESTRGIDVRPANERVYISTVAASSSANSTIRTYTLDTATGAATFVGASANLAGAGDFASGYDVNPATDQIRFVNSSDENARLNPITGALASNDTDLTPALTTNLIDAAHDRNQGGATASTLYVINRSTSALARQGGVDGVPSPDGGVVTDIGPLGFTLNGANDGGFDISSAGTAYAALTSATDGFTRLYTINLATGAASFTLPGLIGGGTFEIRDLAILDVDGDVDGDGVRRSIDNCDSVANADQADLDADGQGDACDSDQDGDGIPDSTETQLGTDPRSTDSDGDGRPDGSDRCPSVAAATANGCPELVPPLPGLTFTIDGFPRAIALKTLRSGGVSLSVTPSREASFLIELRGRLRGARIARAGDLVLAERSLGLAAGKRSVRLKIPKAHKRLLRSRSKLTLRVTATDAGGQASILTRRLTIR
jgi:hypothetical protein